MVSRQESRSDVEKEGMMDMVGSENEFAVLFARFYRIVSFLRKTVYSLRTSVCVCLSVCVNGVVVCVCSRSIPEV